MRQDSFQDITVMLQPRLRERSSCKCVQTFLKQTQQILLTNENTDIGRGARGHGGKGGQGHDRYEHGGH